MAEKPASDRTEKATPERLRKAREEGRVPQSQEVNTAFAVGLMLIALSVAGPMVYEWLLEQMRNGLNFRLTGSLKTDSFCGVFQSRAIECMGVLAPFFLAASAASIFGGVLSGGWSFSTKALKLNFSRLSPAAGLKGLVSLKSLVTLLVSIAKLAVMICIAWSYLKGKSESLLGLYWARPDGVVLFTSQIILGLAIRLAIGLACIALVDLLYQRWNYQREMRMTKQEVKEERKHYEMPSEVKMRIRQIQSAMSRKRMLRRVAKADAVIVNPTHFAVALQYDSSTMPAPMVIAKGADHLCERIKEIARENNVPIIEKPELARALYATVEIDQVVPETLYVAVAEIIAMIYRLQNRRRKQESKS